MLGQLLKQLEKEGFEINGTWNSTLKFFECDPRTSFEDELSCRQDCRMCHIKVKVSPISLVSAANLRKKKDKKRHDNITRMIHWECEV